MAHPLVHENIWFDKWRYDDAEVAYQMGIAAGKSQGGHCASEGFDASDKLQSLAKENAALRKVTDDLWAHVKKLEARVDSLEKKTGGAAPSPAPAATPKPAAPPAQAKTEAKPEAKDDDFELFGDDDEEEDSEEKKRQTEERLAAYAAKKAGKTALVAKSCVILDVKPWDDETDMKAMEDQVRTIVMDGLIWGASKLVPLAYGIKKLQISSVVEDDKVSVDELTELIEGFEELVQSVDIAAFNKL